MTRNTEASPEETHSKLTGLDTVAKYGAILSGSSGLGSLLVSLTGQVDYLEASLIWFQAFSMTSLVFAFLMMALHYEINRDKWPARLKALTKITMLTSALGPDNLHHVRIRAHVLWLRVHRRLALSEGRQALADDFAAEIDTWESRLNSSDD